jgi:hypothetical protein
MFSEFGTEEKIDNINPENIRCKADTAKKSIPALSWTSY